MMGNLSYFSISKMTKSIGKMNLSTFTRMFSITPRGCWYDLSANCKLIVVGFASPNFNLLNIESDIKLMFAPKSKRALPATKFPIENGIEKLPQIFKFRWELLLKDCATLLS